MAHQLASWLGRAGAVSAGVFAVRQAPALAAVACGVGLTLVAALALIGALATSKARRDGAYIMLKLLLDFLRRPRHPDGALPGEHIARR